MGLGDNYIKLDGTISLPICLGTSDARKSVMADFVVLRDSTIYNIIIGRKTINEFSAVICTRFLTMKFITDKGTVGSIRGDLETAVACDSTNLSLKKDLRGQPAWPLIEIVRANGDLFAWTPSDMPGLDPEVMSHRLAIKPDAKPIAQRRRKMLQERVEEVAKQIAGLLEAGFIKELEYSTWLSNVVLVKKASRKWRMCVDYSDLNKACPKDSFPLPNIDTLVDSAAGYRFLTFMDAYSGYNQIPMH
ncbi:uncharacterized protein LOC107614952 [Arachis ipaensis]|nr:uncharacterized protein LOC107614952 [Arachis ipaensis]XP_025678035.1 uncharacterized protein LOC112777865 [Arachis hypogaea]